MATNTAPSANKPPSTFVFQLANGIVSGLLRSPLHGILSNTLILLSFQGKKSGKTYTIPVGYTLNGNLVKIVSRAGWWKNLRKDVPVTLWLKGQQHSGIAEAFYGDENVVEAIMALAPKSQQLRKMYRISLDANGQPNPEDIRRAAAHTAQIRIRLT
jgi:hypothetical protein